MDDTLDLRDYLAVLRRRRWLVVLVTVVVTATAVGVSLLQTPVYEASVDVLVEPLRRSEDTQLESILMGESAVETERRVMTSRPVTERVLADLGLDMEPDELVEDVSTSAVQDARVIELRATSTDAELATAIANSYASSYLEHRRSRAVDELLAAQDELDRRADELREQIAALDAQIEAATSPSAPEATEAPTEPDASALRAERDTLVAQLAQVEASTVSASQPSELVRGGGEVLVPAEVPTTPVAPRPVRTGVLGFVLGLMLGVGLAFLRDHLDDGIRSDEDVRRIANGVPVLGRIAHWDDKRADERLMTLVDPHDAVSEEFRTLSANVRFSLVSHRRQTPARSDAGFRQQSILVTSANPGEGKSSVAGNLAVAASLAGLRVILVDADMRQPTINSRFGVPAGRGVSDILVDELTVGPDGMADQDQIASHLADVGMARLRLLPAGTVPPNPTELLASPQMRLLHERLRSVADLVVYDSPPLLPVADTLELSSYVDAALVVVRTSHCRRRELQDAVERLEAVGAPLSGFVVNDVANVRGQGYGYGYRYGYRPQPPGQPSGDTRTSRRGRRRKRDEPATPTPAAGPTDAVAPAPRQAPGTANGTPPGGDAATPPAWVPDQGRGRRGDRPAERRR